MISYIFIYFFSVTDHIQKFLKEHQGPGVQHVAFTSTSIVKDTQIWHENGVQFLSPPEEYYKIVSPFLNFFFLGNFNSAKYIF